MEIKYHRIKIPLDKLNYQLNYLQLLLFDDQRIVNCRLLCLIVLSNLEYIYIRKLKEIYEE